MRPHKILLPTKYPRICKECPLLGTRPEVELKKGDKFTKWCFFPGNEHSMSGRGTNQENARCRCGKRQYERMLIQNSGEVEISATDAKRYKMQQMAFIFEKREQ